MQAQVSPPCIHVLRCLHLPCVNLCVYVCACVRLCVCTWPCSMLVSHCMCKAAVISQNGEWECEEETRWGSCLMMKDLHLPHMLIHTHCIRNAYSHTCTQRLCFCFYRSHVCMATRLWIIMIKLALISLQSFEICHIVFVHNTQHVCLQSIVLQ